MSLALCPSSRAWPFYSSPHVFLIITVVGRGRAYLGLFFLLSVLLVVQLI